MIEDLVLYHLTKYENKIQSLCILYIYPLAENVTDERFLLVTYDWQSEVQQ